MRNMNFGEEQARGWMFGSSVVGTVTIGLVLIGMGFYFFRTRPVPAQVVISDTPKIEKSDKPASTSGPIKSPPQAPPPPQGPKFVAERPIWEGVWRTGNYPLPAFQLYQDGYSIMGKYAPNWSGVIPFRNGRVFGKTVEFVVTDQIFRAHFRMTMLGPDRAMVEGCVTDEDWLIALDNANRKVRTLRDAVIARAILTETAKWREKPVNLGIFVRGPI